MPPQGGHGAFCLLLTTYYIGLITKAKEEHE